MDKPEDYRPENMPPHHPLTLRECMGLVYERKQTRVPPRAYYIITQLVYFYQGLFSTFFHISLCDVTHQIYHYRHVPSDRYLKSASWCRECRGCPNWIYEHFHRPSKPCTEKCSARPVWRPPAVISHNGHDCRDHICNNPLWYHRRYIEEYPELPYSPFFETFDQFRISRQIAQNGVKPLISKLVMSLKRVSIDKEDIVSPLFPEDH